MTRRIPEEEAASIILRNAEAASRLAKAAGFPGRTKESGTSSSRRATE